jgi:hypothetical protein
MGTQMETIISIMERVTLLPAYLSSAFYIPFGKGEVLVLGKRHILFCFISEMSTLYNQGE